MAKKSAIWSPQPKQALALSCPADEVFYGGARGGGKSDFLLIDFLRNVSYGADHAGVLFRRKYPELEELQRRALQLYPQIGAEYHKTERTWIFPGGASLKMRFLEADEDVHNYQGHQYTWIGFDELTNWATDYCYIYMFSCLRSAAGVPVSMRASGNPGSVGHAWVKARFVDVAPPGDIYTYEVAPGVTMTRCFIPARLEDNEILMKNDPQYEVRLRQLPPHLYRAYREGDWDVFAGQAFPELSRLKHSCRPFPIDSSWRRFASLDWGYTRPFSIGWWALTEDGRFVRYREWYGCDPVKRNVGVQMSAREVAERSFDLSAGEGCEVMVADPACWAKMGLEGSSIADTFAAAGWKMEKGNNDRRGGKQKLHDLLKARGHDGAPMLIVFDTCLQWWRTMPSLVIDERKPEDVDTEGEDHQYDDTRYAIMCRMASIPFVDRRSPFREEANERPYNPLGYGLRAS